MESIKIFFEVGTSHKDRMNLYVDIYEIIGNKSKWHFFYEDLYDELRVEKEYLDTIENILEADDRVWKYYKEEEGWVDSNFPVEKYKNYFTNIFHEHTKLAIQMYLYDQTVDLEIDSTDSKSMDITTIWRLMDRTVHSFFNMISLWSGEYFGYKNQPSYLEVEAMSRYLTSRAFYCGREWQWKKTLKQQEEENDNAESDSEEDTQTEV